MISNKKSAVFTFFPLLVLALGSTGCFSSSSSDSGLGMSEEDAAVAAMIAAGMAGSMEDFAEETNPEEPLGQEQRLLADSGTLNDCAGSGHLYVTESVVSGSSVGLDAAFGYTGSVEMTEVDADCTMDAFGMSSSSHGYSRFGHSPDGTVFFGETTPGPGQSADDGPYVATMNWDGFMSMHQESQMLLHICEGCPELGGGANAEMHLFADLKLEADMMDEPPIDFHLRWGRSTTDRAHVVVGDLGSGILEYEINGFMGFDDRETNCRFGADFETIEPIVMQGAGTQNVVATSGELHMTPENGGSTIRVVYNSDGSATVNGTTYTQEQLYNMVEDCNA